MDEQKKQELYRRKILIAAGRYDKVYPTEEEKVGDYFKEFPEYEYIPPTRQHNYFKIVTHDVTDEEFARYEKEFWAK